MSITAHGKPASATFKTKYILYGGSFENELCGGKS